jgi:hypothetical protein
MVSIKLCLKRLMLHGPVTSSAIYMPIPNDFSLTDFLNVYTYILITAYLEVTIQSCNPPSYQIGHTTRKTEEPVKIKVETR